MSNFSNNENTTEPNLHSKSESESEQRCYHKTAAFLAALRETQNVLNILLQSVTAEGDFIESTSEILTDNVDRLRNVDINEKHLNSRQTNTQNHELDKTVGNECKLKKEVNGNVSELTLPSSLGPPETFVNHGSSYQQMHPNTENDCSSTIKLDSEELSNTSKYSLRSTITDEPKILLTNDAAQTKLLPQKQTSISAKNDNINNSSLNLYQTTSELLLSTSELKSVDPLISKPDKEEIMQNRIKSNNYRNLEDVTLRILNTENIPLAANKIILEKKTDILEQNSFLKEEALKKVTELSEVPKDIDIKSNVPSILSEDDYQISTLDNKQYCAVSGTSQRLLEPTVSTLEREILLRGEATENKKATVLQLPPKSISVSPSRCEKEVVGDDFAKTRTHILCECEQAGVAGGAVPVVTSFTVSSRSGQKDNKSEKETSHHNITPSLISKVSSGLLRTDRSGVLNHTEKQQSLVSPANDEENEERQLPQRLMATTSHKDEKSEDDKNKISQNEKRYQLRFDDEGFEKQKREKKLLLEFSKNINTLSHNVITLMKNNTVSDQIAAIDDLYIKILELKKLSAELNKFQNRKESAHYGGNRSQDTNYNQHPNFELGYKTKPKDNNKISIKFVPIKQGIKKRRSNNTEIQTELTGGVSNDIKLVPDAIEKVNGENNSIDVDSIDGMFIPSLEEPPKMDEDDDEEGLDITITFPEFQQHLMHQANSHLSVSFSDISAEALGRLKRCPKEFTLRMDFVQGKMFFQSGRSTANNVSMGADLKIAECFVDNKMSDIISIKPSTECMYTSQIIPVEGTKPKSSIKTLKSTDSELFNVVSLPVINRRTSGNTKSCITFKNERYSSSKNLLSNKRSYKSMPQIPSLTNIIEEPVLESASPSRAAMITSEKKTRNRSLPKKRINASLDKVSES